MVELLSTKLFIPRARKSLVPRPRLVQRLNAGLDRKLTLIAAPTGFGKTTLLSEWIPQCSRCVTWFSLDEADNDQVKFWAYFISSLQRLQPQLGEKAFALLQSPQAPPIASVLTTLINEITSFPDVFCFVLDDYHVVELQAIHEDLTFFMDHLPANIHVVITTRIDPPLPLARLRAHGQLTELRANDLRFTADESAAFLTEMMGLHLSSEEISALETRTEGWVAGLQIAGLSLQGHEDISGFVRAFSGSHRHILGYLADEVLNRLPEDTLHFLLQTSILERLCAALCDAVTGKTGGQQVLENLEYANLFLTPLDDEGKWYRYHHLFADVLRNRLQQAAAGSDTGVIAIPELHRRASAWFEAAGLMDESIRHALAAPDFERAVSLVEHYSLDMLQKSEIFLIRTWLQELPEELVRTRPRLILAHGWNLILTGHVDALQDWLAAPEAVAALSAPDLPALVLGELILLRATLARFRREEARALALARQALPYLSEDQHGLLAGAMYTIAAAFLQKGDIPSATQALLETVPLGETRGGPYMALSALDMLSEIQIRQGFLSRAIQSSQQAMHMVARLGWERMPAVGMAYIHLGRALYERGDLDGAATALAHGINRLRGSIEQYLLAHGYIALARVHLARGDLEGAFATLQQGKDWFNQMHVADTGAGAMLALGEVRVWISHGHLNAASLWADSRNGVQEDTYLGYLQAVTLVRLRLAQKRRTSHASALQEAEHILNRRLATSEAEKWGGQLIELLILRSLLYRAQGNPVAALASLEQALALSEPEGFLRSFVDEGEPMRLLLSEYHSMSKKQSSGDITNKTTRLLPYVERLLAEFPQPAPIRAQEGPTLLEPLSERELEILRLIATGRTNQEIAELLFIAVSTVKSHINNLYGKLGTQRRTQAIAMARDLGLLDERRVG